MAQKPILWELFCLTSTSTSLWMLRHLSCRKAKKGALLYTLLENQTISSQKGMFSKWPQRKQWNLEVCSWSRFPYNTHIELPFIIFEWREPSTVSSSILQYAFNLLLDRQVIYGFPAPSTLKSETPRSSHSTRSLPSTAKAPLVGHPAPAQPAKGTPLLGAKTSCY